jgi:hypothetical protein
VKDSWLFSRASHEAAELGYAPLVAEIRRFPSSSRRRVKKRSENFAVPCVVSMRWLQFAPESQRVGGDDFITLHVMTGEAHEPRTLLDRNAAAIPAAQRTPARNQATL